MKLKEIEKIAIKIREKFEDNKIDNALLISLYQEYNPQVEDIYSFIDKSKEMFPYLNCGLTSLYLQHILQKGKIIQGKYNGTGHTFLLLPEYIVVDITTDQFRGPKYYVGKLREPWVLG